MTCFGLSTPNGDENDKTNAKSTNAENIVASAKSIPPSPSRDRKWQLERLGANYLYYKIPA